MIATTADDSPHGKFDALFGRGALERWDAMRAALLSELRDAPGILIHGSGRTGRMVAQALRAAGHVPLGFADDTPSKQGTEIHGLRVWSPTQALSLHGDRPLVVVALFSPGHSFRGTRRQLQELGYRSVVSIFAAAACLAEALLPFYFFERPDRVLAARNQYRRLFEMLADRQSREELVRHLEFRLHVDPDALPEPCGLDYGYFAGRLPDDVYFIDGGAFDGDSVQAFLKLAGERFSGVTAFEPDACNFGKLTAFREALPESTRGRVELFNGGLWSETARLRFDATGTPGSTLGDGFGTEVAVVALDDHVRTSRPLFIKYDVEGAERNALLGTRRLLERGDATLVVAVYHQPDDLWSLPALIREINPAYRFGLRSHGDDGADLMLYAVPPFLQAAEAGNDNREAVRRSA